MDFANIICVFLSTLLLHPGLGQDESTVQDAKATSSFSIKIIPGQQDQMVQMGSKKIYTCKSSSEDNSMNPVLHWEINDVKITATAIDERIRIESTATGDLRLRIENVMDGDEGTYKCVGTLGIQTDSRTIRVEVFDAIKINSPTSQFGLRGETGIVSCNATGKPAPTVSWKFENTSNIEDATGEKYLVQGIQLVIKNLQFEDTGTYLCDVTVMATGDNELVKINFEVIQIPEFESEPTIRPSNSKVGDEVTVSCQADGVPEPTYQFKKDDSFMRDDQMDKINGVLTIKDLKQDDEGDYVCVATNRGGSAEKTIFLDVKIPPSILDMPETTEAEEGEQKLVMCQAEGDPAPTVTWQKEGHDVYEAGSTVEGVEINSEPGTDGTSKITGVTLSFASVKPQDADDYVCTAFSDVGKASKTITLEVKYKPHFNTDFKQKEFYGWEGHTANMTCLASSNEVATISWFKMTSDGDSVPLTSDGPYNLNAPKKWPEHHLSSSSIMVTVGTDESVYGDYQCEAANSLGSVRHTVMLQQAEAPHSPKVIVTNVWSTMVTLEVQAPTNDGGQPVLGYYVSYHQTNDTTDAEEKHADANPDTTYVDLRNLVAKTSYVAKVRAHNAVGHGMEETVLFDTKEVSQPLKLNMTSPRVGSESTSYEVVWSDPDDGGATITHFLIKYKKVTVIDEEADQWQTDSDIDTQFEEKELKDPKVRSYKIPNLKHSSFYEIRITAINKEGESTEEIKIVKTSEGGVQTAQTVDGEDEEEEDGDKEDAEYNDENRDKDDVVENKKNEEDGKAGDSLGSKTKSDKTDSAGIGSGTVIGIVVGLLILIVIIAVVISLVFKKKPELVGRLRGLGGKGGEEERGKGDDGKDPAEEEKLIKKEDTVKVENETEEGKPEQMVEEHQEEFEPDNKPEAPSSPEVGAKNGTADKPPELSTPAPTTEIKITPETPEKPEDPPA